LEAATGIEPMNKAFAERDGEPQKSLLVSKNGASAICCFAKDHQKGGKTGSFLRINTKINTKIFFISKAVI
jgi:hypothetical protein